MNESKKNFISFHFNKNSFDYFFMRPGKMCNISIRNNFFHWTKDLVAFVATKMWERTKLKRFPADSIWCMPHRWKEFLFSTHSFYFEFIVGLFFYFIHWPLIHWPPLMNWKHHWRCMKNKCLIYSTKLSCRSWWNFRYTHPISFTKIF